MSLWNILGMAICSAAILGIVRQLNRDISIYVSVACAVVLMYFALKYFQPLVDLLLDTGNIQGVSGYAKAIMKLTAIGVLTSVVSDICTDMGEASVASKVELVGKGAAAYTVLPILENLLVSVREFLM